MDSANFPMASGIRSYNNEKGMVKIHAFCVLMVVI